MVVICLNSDPHHLIANFPPTIETIQDEVLHALRSYGFQNTADAYECYRWGRHWLREGAITETQFVGNGFPKKRMERILDWNRQRGCDTVAGLNEIVRGKRGVTPDTALRLAQVLGMAADFWMGLQMDWDLWHAMRGKNAAAIAQLAPVNRAS